MEKEKKEKIEKTIKCILNYTYVFFIGAFFTCVLITPRNTISGKVVSMILMVVILLLMHFVDHH